MAQPPKNKAKTPGKAPADKPQGDSYFDEFFANPQPHQLDENPEQQREWISDHLMWETTLGMRDDETIDKAITPEDLKAKSTDQQTAPASPKRQLSEAERQLLRSEFSDTPAPTTPQPSRASIPAERQPAGKVPIQRPAARASRAPVKTVPNAQHKPAAEATRQTSTTQRRAAPHTHTQPVRMGVAREADLSLVEDIQNRQEGVGKTLSKFGIKAFVVLSVVLISLFIGYYFGGKNTSESVVKVEKPSIATDTPQKKKIVKNTKKTKRPQQPNRAPTQTATQVQAQQEPPGTTFEGTDIESVQYDENGMPVVNEETTTNFLPLPEAAPQSSVADDGVPAPQPETASTDLQKLLDESLQKFEEKQWESVITLSDQILAIDPNVVTALTNRAVAYAELGSYALALNDCNLAIEIDPNSPLAINNRGYVYEKMGDTENAIKEYEMACTLGVEISCKEVDRLKQAQYNGGIN